MCLKEVMGNVHGNHQERMTFRSHMEDLQGTEKVSAFGWILPLQEIVGIYEYIHLYKNLFQYFHFCAMLWNIF